MEFLTRAPNQRTPYIGRPTTAIDRRAQPLTTEKYRVKFKSYKKFVVFV